MSETQIDETLDFSFPLETATTNIMSTPFDMLQLPGGFPQNEWIEGTIEVFKLHQNDNDGGNLWFSMKIRPDDPQVMVFDTMLSLVKKGQPHAMMVSNATFAKAIIGGKIEGGKLRTAEGSAAQADIEAACDSAIKRQCRFQVQTKGEFTNLKKFEML